MKLTENVMFPYLDKPFFFWETCKDVSLKKYYISDEVSIFILLVRRDKFYCINSYRYWWFGCFVTANSIGSIVLKLFLLLRLIYLERWRTVIYIDLSLWTKFRISKYWFQLTPFPMCLNIKHNRVLLFALISAGKTY